MPTLPYLIFGSPTATKIKTNDKKKLAQILSL
jgi:hypothetical protein